MSQSLGLPMSPNLSMSVMLIYPTEYLAARRQGVALLAGNEVNGFGKGYLARLHLVEEECLAAACEYRNDLIVNQPFGVRLKRQTQYLVVQR